MTSEPQNRISSILKKFFPFFIFLTLFKFAGGLQFTMLAPLGAKLFPLWMVGLLIGANGLLQLVLDIPAGYILDRFGYKKMMLITTFFFIIATASLLFGLNAFTYLFTVFGSTFGWLFFGSGANAYIINQAEEKSVGRFESAKDVFASFGIVLSSALVIFAVAFSSKVLGYTLIGIFVAAFLVLLVAPGDRQVPKEHRTASKKYQHFHKSVIKQSYDTIMRLRPASLLLVCSSFSASTFYAIIWFVVPLLIANAVHNGVLGIGLGIFDFSVVVLGFLLGKIVDSFEKKRLILIGLLIFSIAGILLGMNFGFLFLLLGFIATTGDELTGLSLWAWLYNIDTKHESYGLISGIIGLFDDLGWTVGPIIAGVLYSWIGPAWAIAVGGMLISINIAIFFFVVKDPLPESLISVPRKPHRYRHKH